MIGFVDPEVIVNALSLSRLIAVALALLAVSVRADDENFGKDTPDQNKIIEIFKPEQAADAEAPEPGVKMRGINIIDAGKAKPKHKPVTPVLTEKAISMEVLFDYNSATLTEQAKQQLQPVGQALASEGLKGLHYRIEGHTDVVGGDEFNIELSRRRAEAVKAYLVEQYGLGDVAIDVEGKGKKQLADKFNPTSEVNRRVRIVRLGE